MRHEHVQGPPPSSVAFPGHGARAGQTPLVVAVALLALVVWPRAGLAGGPRVDIQRMRLDPGPGALFGETRPEVLPHLGWSAGMWVDLQSEPLVFDSERLGTVPVVDTVIQSDLTLSVGLFDRVELGMLAPYTLSTSGEAPPADEAPGIPAGDGSGVGDLGLRLKVAALRGTVSLSGVLGVTAPTGDEALYRGDAGVGGLVGLSSSLDLDRVELVANLGYRIRDVVPLPGTVVGDELTFGLGARAGLIPDRFELRMEVSGGTGLGDLSFGGESETAVEARIGAAVWPLPSLGLVLGGGVPVIHGIGVPIYRLFGGVYWSPREYDRDRDGIPDQADRCVGEPEDKDGFQDDDGCPDPDNDEDGIPDGEDKCPAKPETYNGKDDGDGCPDPGESHVRLQGSYIRLDRPITFANGDADLPKWAFPLLDQVASLIKHHHGVEQVRILGVAYQDEKHAKDLAEARAQAALAVLLDAGLSWDELKTKGLVIPRSGEPGGAKGSVVGSGGQPTAAGSGKTDTGKAEARAADTGNAGGGSPESPGGPRTKGGQPRPELPEGHGQVVFRIP